MNKALISSLSLIFLSACFYHDIDVKPIPKDGIIIALGDSMTMGVGVKKSESYPSVLAKLTGRKVINGGKFSQTMQSSLKRLVPYLKKYKPAMVIIALGTNDLRYKQSPEKIKKYLTIMIGVIKKYSAVPVIVSAPMPSYIPNTHSLFLEVGKANRVLVINDLQMHVFSKKQYRADKGHLNKKGYEAMANGIYKALVSNKFIVTETEKADKVKEK